MKNFIYTIVISCLLLCSCNQDEVYTGLFKSRYFITEYLIPTDISIVVVANYILLKATGEVCSTCCAQGHEKAMYFAELYNDTSYNGNIHPGMHSALAYPIDKITICCDKDFNNQHQAGESLDDIVKLDFKSFYPYIKGGYKKLPNTSETPPGRHKGEVMHYALNFNSVEANLTKLMSIGLTNYDTEAGIAEIKFKTTPDIPGEYTFTLAVDMNGETMTTTFTYTFE